MAYNRAISVTRNGIQTRKVSLGATLYIWVKKTTELCLSTSTTPYPNPKRKEAL
jgi:hypothetical protein